MELKRKVVALKDLMQFAIDRNLPVDHEIIRAVNELCWESRKRFENDGSSNGEGYYGDLECGSFGERVDVMVQKLTNITYPTTIETVEYSKNSSSINIVNIIYALSVATIGLAVFMYAQANESVSGKFYDAGLSVCMGMLGTLVYSFFHILGLYQEKAVSELDRTQVICRLFLGAILGFFFYFTWCGKAFDALLHKSTFGDAKDSLLLAFPFLAGYSTKLVFGVLDQMVSMIELTLGLDNKKKEMLKK